MTVRYCCLIDVIQFQPITPFVFNPMYCLSQTILVFDTIKASLMLYLKIAGYYQSYTWNKLCLWHCKSCSYPWINAVISLYAIYTFYWHYHHSHNCFDKCFGLPVYLPFSCRNMCGLTYYLCNIYNIHMNCQFYLDDPVSYKREPWQCDCHLEKLQCLQDCSKDCK